MKNLATAVLTTLAMGTPLLAATLVQDAAAPAPAKPEKIEPYKLGARVDPEITLPGIDGKSYRLGDFKDQVVVLDFWSIQCPWSIKYEERLLQLHAKYKAKGVIFLAIDANHAEVDWDAEKPYARIAEYVEKTKVTYPVLIDEGNLVADLFGGQTTPHVFVLNAKGELAYRGGIDNNPKMDESKETTHYVADALDALLAGKPVEQPESKPMGCSIKRVKKERLQ